MHDNTTAAAATAAGGNMHSPLVHGRRRQREMAYTATDLRPLRVDGWEERSGEDLFANR